VSNREYSFHELFPKGCFVWTYGPSKQVEATGYPAAVRSCPPSLDAGMTLWSRDSPRGFRRVMKILKRKITALPGDRMVPIYRDHTALSVRTGPGRAGIYDASSKEEKNAFRGKNTT